MGRSSGCCCASSVRLTIRCCVPWIETAWRRRRRLTSNAGHVSGCGLASRIRCWTPSRRLRVNSSCWTRPGTGPPWPKARSATSTRSWTSNCLAPPAALATWRAGAKARRAAAAGLEQLHRGGRTLGTQRPSRRADRQPGPGARQPDRRPAAVCRRRAGRREPLAVLKVRPSKQAPPSLVLDAIGYRPYQKLPNLFLPAGPPLQPPLRRDAVRKLLANERRADRLAVARAGGPIHAAADCRTASFRPLADWVDYVLDHDRQALTAWMQSTRFDFEPFVCPEESAPPKAKPRAGKRRGPEKAEEPPDTPPRRPKARACSTTAAGAEGTGSLIAIGGAAGTSALEKQFLDLEGPLDLPERQALWPRLAELNAALDRNGDAAVCWLHGIWENGAATRLVERWFEQESGKQRRRHRSAADRRESSAGCAAVPGGRDHPSGSLAVSTGEPASSISGEARRRTWAFGRSGWPGAPWRKAMPSAWRGRATASWTACWPAA